MNFRYRHFLSTSILIEKFLHCRVGSKENSVFKVVYLKYVKGAMSSLKDKQLTWKKVSSLRNVFTNYESTILFR